MMENVFSILIVDDDTDLAQNFKDILEDKGYGANVTYNGKDALKLTGSKSYDLALIDIKLPDIKGMDLVEEIAKISPDTEYIIMTGYASIESAARAVKERNIIAYETKPVDIENVISLIRQVQKRKLLEVENENIRKQLLQSQKMEAVGILAGGVAHEINNPLTTISMNAAAAVELLEKMLDSLTSTSLCHRQKEAVIPEECCVSAQAVDKLIKKLKVVESETNRAAEIVKSLLVLSRKSRGERDRKSLDINDIIKATLDTIEHQLELDNIKIGREFTADLPHVITNANQLQQVFLNLINNARDAMMPKGGTLKINTRSQKSDDGSQTIEISFSDTGKGIPKEELNKIFDAFYTTKDPGKGTGLGLSISQSIIANHGGQIFVESKAGSGTTFTVKLPTKPI